MAQYSFSRLDTYNRCPRAYRLLYLDRIPRARSEALVAGALLHDLVAQYLDHLISTSQPTDWEWARAAVPQDGPPEVADIWDQFVNRFVMPQGIEEPGVEHQLAFTRAWEPCDWFADVAWFRMVVDFHYRQGPLVVVVDWKTNRQTDIDAHNLQLRTYGWGIRRALYPQAEEVLLRLHYLRYGQEREVLLTPADLNTVPRELEEAVRWIEGDSSFDPTPGSYCGYCGVTVHCPVMASALVPTEIILPATREQAEKAAQVLLALQQMEKNLSARLRDWVRENGPVQVGDIAYDITPTTTYNLDPEAVVQTLLDGGLEREAVWPLLTVTKTNLERGLKRLRRPDLLAPALECGQEERSERVGWKKVK